MSVFLLCFSIKLHAHILIYSIKPLLLDIQAVFNCSLLQPTDRNIFDEKTYNSQLHYLS